MVTLDKEHILNQSIRHFFRPHRILALFSFLTLSVAFILSLLLEPDSQTWIPYTQVSVPIVNGMCAFLCIVLIIKPELKWIETSILFVQSFFTLWTGYETLGLFLYSTLIFLLFCHGFFKEHLKKRILLIILLWLLILTGIIPHGLARTILTYATAMFMLAVYYVVYFSLKDFLSPLLPVQNDEAKIKLLPTDTKIDLNKCGLTETELKLLKYFLENDSTYEEMSEIFYMSNSTIKKYMSMVIKKFGVKNNTELKQLLSNRALYE